MANYEDIKPLQVPDLAKEINVRMECATFFPPLDVSPKARTNYYPALVIAIGLVKVLEGDLSPQIGGTYPANYCYSS